ncbi:MAG: hypothetical protein ACOC6P_03570 [Candidatus Aminicenantaceae bacterium]
MKIRSICDNGLYEFSDRSSGLVQSSRHFLYEKKQDVIPVYSKRRESAGFFHFFWSLVHKNSCIALNEDLSRYAQGETFWKALFNLCETTEKCEPSQNPNESRMKKTHKKSNKNPKNMII